MAAESVKSLHSARRIGMTWMILCLGGAVAVGYFGIAYFGANPADVGALAGKKERIFIALTTLLFNPWIVGIILSAILAAVMSTLSCQLLLCSSAITEDFYKGFFRPNASQKELVWLGRMMVLLIAVISIVIAYNPESEVLGLVANAWAGFGAAFGPVVILSLLWKRMTAKGALAGMIAGAVVVIAWGPMFKDSASWLKNVYEMIPGFIACGLAVVIVSLLDKAPSTAVQQRFDEADAAYRRAE